MSSVITKSGSIETLVVGPIVDVTGAALTGLANITVAVFRKSDKRFLDWGTMGFTQTPQTEYQAMAQVDPVRAPGVYYLDINTALFVGATTQDTYFVYVSQQGGTNAANALQMGEFRVGQIVDAVEANLDAKVSLVPHGVWATDVSGYGTLAQTHLAGGALYAVKVVAFNRMVETPGNPGQIVVYRDDGATPYATMTLRDGSANSVITVPGEPAQRGAAS